MKPGMVLVHGYTGGPESLTPLADRLITRYGSDAVTCVSLPGHENGAAVPPFDAEVFEAQILNAVNACRKEGRKVVLIGHSTGGCLALSCIRKHALSPALLVLAGVPKRIDSNGGSRWEKHRGDMATVPFIEVAKMISHINRTGKPTLDEQGEILIIHGEADELVPAKDALDWCENRPEGAVRLVLVPGGGHHLFSGPSNALAIDSVLQAVSDIETPSGRRELETIDTISSIEPELSDFIARSPSSGRHVAHCPSGRRAINAEPAFDPIAANEPVFTNIEITTHCNLRCSFCARTKLGRSGKNMTPETFRKILGFLPHAYRITLVGLGEPLMHPNVVDLVKMAADAGRRVALVTNAMFLDEPLARALLDAGLHAIAFSIDAPGQQLTDSIRPGTDLNKVFQNISRFITISEARRPISKAVFCAVSMETVPHLERLISIVSGLGVNVMMLTDLNYDYNSGKRLWKNADNGTIETIRKAVKTGFEKKLPLLSVQGLEEFGLSRRYKDFLLLPPAQLYQRSARHTWCHSPWQTVPVDVNGNITLCDCQPDQIADNILERPLSEIWNGEAFSEYRRRMRSHHPPEACRICPRF